MKSSCLSKPFKKRSCLLLALAPLVRSVRKTEGFLISKAFLNERIEGF
jgi:hypothetical protein